MNDFLTSLSKDNDNYNLSIVNSKVLSDVWGRGIQVFEFQIAVDEQDVTKKLSFLKQNLKLMFEDRNSDPKINDHQIKITDLWQYDRFIHIEIAYLANQSTREYINDLERLTE
ncbi:hypothetical protein MOO44_06080 [Nicoliella spurrieriana]|uniref:Uncharacterized protein n=1 Tax=Nicoliella spurrieriana TaxID=2925830 RepID=A0A976X569_9LACO|nr:hypothetical protein MOO44_06080 [Nicoliella spurrieriana]